MKLRRALVTAAATAAMAPIALLSAPAAFATGTPTAPGTVESTETTTTAPETTAGETPGTSTPDPSATETAEETETPAAGTGETTSPAVSDTTTPATTPDPSETDDDGDTGDDDECTGYEDSPGTLAELRDLPSEIVAGSGWHGFTFRVSNKTDADFETVSTQLYAFSYAYDEDTTETSKYLHVQFSDKSGWHDIDTAIDVANDEPFTELGPLARGKHTDVKLRIKVDAKAPAGLGGGVAFATSVDAEGVCGYSVPEDQEYRFEVLPAGTKPGSVPPATSAPKPTNTPAPQSSSTPLAGSLAETGSSSALPTVGLIGGVAVVAGAGVVYSVRRRKVGNEA
ncbi:peptidase [Streptomyces sp. NPDC050264]|uniref:peptidase n=1 Tax=Streptomyces sp. NPDC050264 TaxID=3155038 RepID=UPI00343BF73E